jgi:hypothetical protein
LDVAIRSWLALGREQNAPRDYLRALEDQVSLLQDSPDVKTFLKESKRLSSTGSFNMRGTKDLSESSSQETLSSKLRRQSGQRKMAATSSLSPQEKKESGNLL